MLAKAYYGRSERTAVLELRGAIRYNAARALRTFVDDVITHDDSDAFVVDLRGVDFIDSTGMGLLARLARWSLEHRGRRIVLVCPAGDVSLTLCSAAFDRLTVMVEDFPFEDTVNLTEVVLEVPSVPDPTLGRIILEAHCDLASLSERNRNEYGDVIIALEADLRRRQATG